MKRLAGLFVLAVLVGLGCGPPREDGPYVVYYEDGTRKEEGTYRDGELHGFFVQYREDGTKKYEGLYEDGKLNGELVYYESFVEYYDAVDGQKLRVEGTYKDGQRDGPYAVYYASGGKKVEGAYSNVRKDSVWAWYDERGEKIKQELWDEGELIQEVDCRAHPNECR